MQFPSVMQCALAASFAVFSILVSVANAQTNCDAEVTQYQYEDFTSKYQRPTDEAAKRDGIRRASALVERIKRCHKGEEEFGDVLSYLESWLKRQGVVETPKPKGIDWKVDGFHYGDEGWEIDGDPKKRFQNRFLDRWRPINVEPHPSKKKLVNTPNELLVVFSPYTDLQENAQVWYRINCDANTFKIARVFVMNKVAGTPASSHPGFYGREEDWMQFTGLNDKLLRSPCSKVNDYLKKWGKQLLN